MAFSSSIKHKTIAGSFQISAGTFNADSVTTGDIDTGMGYLYSISFGEKGSSADTLSGIHYNETIPGAVGHAVTIHCKENASGVWIAYGR